MRTIGWGLVVAILLAVAPVARAQDLTPQDIVKALTPKPNAPPTRGLRISGVDAAETPPQIDLTVNFEFDSSELTEQGVAQLSKLGVALGDPALKAFSFRVVGHTDAKGAPDYNLSLSERRAQAVGAYLSRFYAVDPARLAMEGRGASQLKDPVHPEDGVNRRVQIVTLTR